MFKIFERLGVQTFKTVAKLGEFFLFTRSVIFWSHQKPFRPKLILQQMEFIGVRSFWVIALTATFTGMVFALQTGYAFRLFHAETMVGSTVGLALTREIGPVFTALMVVARAGSAMAAEIGTMKVTEQVDALAVMAVNPIHYLVVPRVIASTLVLPCLTAFFVFIGLVGAFFVSTKLLLINEAGVLQKLTYYVDTDDLWSGLIKSCLFGFVLALVGCYEGYRTEGGAKGVGRSTTRAVVVSSVVILILDYFVTTWLLEIFHD